MDDGCCMNTAEREVDCDSGRMCDLMVHGSAAADGRDRLKTDLNRRAIM